jgi:hypothetical protein
MEPMHRVNTETITIHMMPQSLEGSADTHSFQVHPNLKDSAGREEDPGEVCKNLKD